MPAWSDRLIQLFRNSFFEEADKVFYNVLNQSVQPPSALDSVVDSLLQKPEEGTIFAENSFFDAEGNPPGKPSNVLHNQERSPLNDTAFKDIIGPLGDPGTKTSGDIEFGDSHFPEGLDQLENFDFTGRADASDKIGRNDIPDGKSDNFINFTPSEPPPDTDAPTQIIAIDSISNDSGLSNSDFITNDDGLSIFATLSDLLGPGEAVQYSPDDGVTWQAVPPTSVVGTGITFFDVNFNTSNTIKFRVIDTALNTGPEAEQFIIIDVTAPAAPTVEITEDANDDGLISGGELAGAIDVQVTLPVGSVAGETVTVSDGMTTTPILLTAAHITAGFVTTSFASPGDGNSITVTASVTDLAGNVGASGDDSATVDGLVA